MLTEPALIPVSIFSFENILKLPHFIVIIFSISAFQ
jgi:hypothetical protein